MKARKSKQPQHNEKLLLTRVLSLESVFDRNYDRLWSTAFFDSEAEDDSKKSKKPAWNKKMSAGLAENNAEMMGYISPESISSMIRERLNYIDIRKSHSNILSAQTHFLDDDMVAEGDANIDSIFGHSQFGVSRKESAENLKEIADLTDIDDETDAEEKIDITPLAFSFLGEKNSQSAPKTSKKSAGQPATKPTKKPVRQAPKKPTLPPVADPNDDLLDMAAWGLTEEDDTTEAKTPDINMAMDMDVAPAQEMADFNNQPPAQNMSAKDTTSSDIVSVDNLLKNIGYHGKQTDSNQQDIQSHHNAQPNIDMPSSTDLPFASEHDNAPENIHGNMNHQPQQQTDKNLPVIGDKPHQAQSKSHKQALKAQKRAEKQAEKQMRQAQKQARKAESQAEKNRLKAQKQERKQEKQIKKTRSIRDILKENSKKTTPLTADEIALQAEFGGMASTDDNTNHAENILDNINKSSADSTPHYQQIQKTFDNNPLSSMEFSSANVNLPQTPEHQQAAVNEIKHMLGTDNNTASSDSILNDFANLQQKMAEKMNKK